MTGKMRIVQSSGLPPVPWRNRGGVTREVASANDDNGLVWRISLADVTAEGPFSAFVDLSRISTVITGGGMGLDTGTEVLDASPFNPVRYDGNPPVSGRLPHGPVQNFNVVFRPDAVSADVVVLEGPLERRLDAGDGGTLALHMANGTAEVEGRRVPEGATAILQAAHLVLPEGARMVAATFTARPTAAAATIETA